MHLQIKGSPGDTASNVRHVVNALARKGINIAAIAPDFDPPHVRVLVEHAEPYDPTNPDDPFNQALTAMEEDGLTPEVKAGLHVSMPNKPRALKIALDRLTREGYEVESILVLPGEPSPGVATVAFGVARTNLAGWDAESEELEGRIEADLDGLQE
jgi:hypothetical protein